MGEFDLIETYFRWDNVSDDSDDLEGVIIGIGDDAAVLQLESNQQLVTSIDTLISGVHFPEQTPAAAIAHKALSVNLSDIAAMGAEAKWFTLALTLPDVDHAWLKEFSTNLKALAAETSVNLVGGDTTRGSLSISIQVMGTVKNNHALLRSGAKPGDKIFVTGTLGDAAVGLASIQGHLDLSNEDKAFCEARLNYPTARLEDGDAIKEYATSCIDVSDGLLQDLGHILKKSKASAVIDLDKLPLSECLQNLNIDLANKYALSGGDDYELLFTVPAEKQQMFTEKVIKKNPTQITMIGEISNQYAIGAILNSHGINLTGTGYNHFSDDISDNDKSDK